MRAEHGRAHCYEGPQPCTAGKNSKYYPGQNLKILLTTMCCRGLKWWPRRLPRQGSYELLVLYSKKEQPRSSSQKKNKLFNQLNMRLLLGCGPHILISFCPRSHGQFDGLGVTSRVKSYEDSPIQTHQKRVKEAEEP